MRFSEHFHVTKDAADDWYDPMLNIDTALGIDPFLVFTQRLNGFATTDKTIAAFFESQFQLLATAQGNDNSVHYKRALRNLKLGEFEPICLGYAENDTAGSGAGDDLSESMAAGMTEAIQLGVQNASHFEEVSIFRKGFGPDRISDIVARIMLPDLAAYTKAVCDKHNVPTQNVPIDRAVYDATAQTWTPAVYELPLNPDNGMGVVLVPERYLRADRTITPGGFWRHSYDWHNADLRAYFGDEITRRADRAAILALARHRPELVTEYLEATERTEPQPYDLQKDPGLRVKWDAIARAYVERRDLRFAIQTEAEFLAAIEALMNEFKHFVEQNGGWLLLRNDNSTPREERVSQRLMLGIVQQGCKANDIAVTKEADIGRGAVDFSFSLGYSKRALAEVKLASNTRFWKGLEAQLPTYLKAERTDNGYFVVVAYNDDEIKKVGDYAERLRALNEKLGTNINVILVDARRPPSASTVAEAPAPQSWT